MSELTAAIRGLLETSFGDVWVEGEISNCRVWNTGHVYFTLKDGDAQIKAVMFRSAVRYLKFKPEDGLHVIARGRLGVYEPKGEYQIVCEHLEPHGLGALQLAFEQLKKKLQAEGLFDRARKRPLPSLPRKIGIVTSLDGAALRDIIKVLRRRHPNAHLVIRPDARAGRRRGRRRRARRCARSSRSPASTSSSSGAAAGRSRICRRSTRSRWHGRSPPRRCRSISAVGHEIDVTIADFVADLRAPTPSAAAEMVVAAKDEFCAPHRSADAAAHDVGADAGAPMRGRHAA